MESPSAQLGEMQISKMSATIPSFKPGERLLIYANGAGSGRANRPYDVVIYQNSLGKVLNDEVQVSGPLSADIKLDIPLKGKDVVASGTAHLSSNPVYIASTGMLFDNATGDITFTNGDIDADGLAASFLNQPVEMAFSGRQGDNYDLHVELGGRWHVHPLANYVNTQLTDYIDGEAKWQTDVDLVLGKADFSYKATLNADLGAMQSVLPSPLTPQLVAIFRFISKVKVMAKRRMSTRNWEVKFALQGITSSRDAVLSCPFSDWRERYH